MSLLEHVLLCEGTQDAAFFRHLIKKRDLPEFAIISPRGDPEPGGVNGYTHRLRALKLESEFWKVKRILVFGDSDYDPKAAFANIRALIDAAGGFPLPNCAMKLASAKNQPSVMVALLPWDDTGGRLETLCIEAFSSQHPRIAECVENFCECTGVAAWKSGPLEKMRMRSMIASTCEEDPYTSLVHAWSRKTTLIPLDHKCFDRISTLLVHFTTMPNDLE